MKSVKASLAFAGLAPGLMLTARVAVDRRERIEDRYASASPGDHIHFRSTGFQAGDFLPRAAGFGRMM